MARLPLHLHLDHNNVEPIPLTDWMRVTSQLQLQLQHLESAAISSSRPTSAPSRPSHGQSSTSWDLQGVGTLSSSSSFDYMFEPIPFTNATLANNAPPGSSPPVPERHTFPFPPQPFPHVPSPPSLRPTQTDYLVWSPSQELPPRNSPPSHESGYQVPLISNEIESNRRSHEVRPVRPLSEREQFLLFIKILFWCLDRVDHDPHQASATIALRRNAKAVVRECTRRNRQGDVRYMPLQEAVERRLRGMVGERHWQRAQRYLQAYCQQKGLRMTRPSPRQRSEAPHKAMATV